MIQPRRPRYPSTQEARVFFMGEALYGLTVLGTMKYRESQPPFGRALYGLTVLGTLKYGRQEAAYYAFEGPWPPPEQFVIPPEALDPRTPLMSIAASGQIAKQYIFYLRATKVPHRAKHLPVRQIVSKYHSHPPDQTPCVQYVQGVFRSAVAAWHALTPTAKIPYERHVTHYGLVMEPFNLFISKFIKARLQADKNPCVTIGRKRKNRLARRPGRT